MTTSYELAQKAIEAGDPQQLQSLLQDDPQVVHGVDDYNNSLLHHAAAGGSVKLVDVLLDAGARIQQQGNDGGTPLHWAASMNHVDVCRRLVAAGGDVHRSDDLGEGGTPLVQALFYGHREAAEMLAELAIVPNNLRVAAGLGRVDLLQTFFDATGGMLADAGRDRSWYRPHDEVPERPTTDDPQEVLDEALCYACFNDRLEAAQFLLDHGADPNSKPHFATALHFATAKGNRELIDLLFDRGADATIEDDSYASDPAGWATWGGDESLAEYLCERAGQDDILSALAVGDTESALELLADLDDEDIQSEWGAEALGQAIVLQQQSTVDVLRQRGAKLDLFTAASLGLDDEVGNLLSQGADPDETVLVPISIPGQGAQERPQTVLMVAAINRRSKVCQQLRAAGATTDAYHLAALNDVDGLKQAVQAGHPLEQEDGFGRTVLHRAIQGNATDAVRWLLETGADVDKSSDFYSYGGRALHVAAQCGASPEVFEMLFDAGGDINAALNPGTPLDCALRGGQEQTAEWLRQRGAMTGEQVTDDSRATD